MNAAARAPLAALLVASLVTKSQPVRADEPADGVRAERLLVEARESLEAGDAETAFRLHARAWRWDPGRDEALAALPRLAAQCNRLDAAVRYAVIAVRVGLPIGDESPDGRTPWGDERFVRRLAHHAAERGDDAEAAELWETVYRLAKGDTRRLTAALQAGRSWFVAGESEDASDWFRRVANHPKGERIVATLDDPAGLWEGVVACHLDAGRVDAAQRAAARLSEDAHARAPYWRARIAAARGRHAAAYEAVRVGIAAGDGGPNGDAFALLVETLSAMNQSSRVVDELRSVIAAGAQREAERDPAAWLALVEALASAGRFDEAIAEATRLVEASLANGRDADDRWGDVVLADGAERLIALLAERRDTRRLWPFLGRLAGHWGSLEAVREPIEAALSDAALRELAAVWLTVREPKAMSQEALTVAGRVALASGDSAAAGRFYRPLILGIAEREAEDALAGEASLAGAWFSAWSGDLMDADAWDALVAAMRWAEAERPGLIDGYARYRFALAVDALGDTEEALAIIRTARRDEPDDPFHAELEATFLADLERLDEAIAVVESALRSPSLAEESLRWMADDLRIDLAHLLDLRDADGDAARGDERFERVLDFDPHHAHANNDLAYRWSERGVHLDRALRMAEVAVAAEPRSSAYADTRGWVLNRLGRHEEAATELRRAVALLEAGSATSDDAVLYEHLAAALEATGHAEAAETARGAAESLSADSSSD